ncbi:sensor histidine kinase [Singulisphaera sp. GP187]|uniref:sensor histidine kinase n=1 Tax=Singulisphaera sp. GP187 TaxID=1882752 RepID=UPI0020B16AC9|nr:sensor histidine kinase [Singulisphaera sp. GP187]
MLTNARAIRLLAPDKAAMGLPVRLEAVITYFDMGATTFVQDDTGGTFYQGLPRHPDWRCGLRVLIEGKSFSGLYVPGIKATKVHVIGPGALPAPLPITADVLASGRYHYQWIELEGIGRSVTVTGENTSVLRLASGSSPVEVRIDELPAGHLDLVDARLRIQGLAAGFINDRRQLVLPHLKVRGFRDVAILDAPPDPAQLPLVSVDDQLRFPPNGASGRRVKVRGVVISDQPHEPIFLRAGGRGLLVESRRSEAFEPGDLIEVLGFPEMGTFRAFLADATTTRVGNEPAPTPHRVTAQNLLTGIRDADLVELEGELAASFAGTEGVVLTIQAGETAFRVRCPSGPRPQWTQGSRLSVSGICRIADTVMAARSYRVQPVSFDLWARSPEDIRLLRSPTWWTPRRLTAAVAALVSATVAALIWVFLLRRRIREQTAIIRSQLAREIVLDERQRIAREVHDTLEQELVGLALRLDAAASVADPRLVALLEAARHLVDRIHAELRILVWDLREQEDGPRDLGEMLARSTQELQTSPTTQLDLTVTGTPWPLAAPVEHNLLRIAQETITNALKHAEPCMIQIQLSYDPEAVSLRIQDDGRGFETDGPAAVKLGHFGLIGVRERARKMGAQLELSSELGQGTTIKVTVPRARQLLGGTEHGGREGDASANRDHNPGGG